MKQILSLLLILLSSQILFSQNDSIDWVADLTYIKNELPKKHYDLFFKLTENEFSKQIDKLINDVPDLGTYEILDKLNQIIAQIGDSHTSLDYGYLNNVNKILPLGFYWFSDGIYVTHANISNQKLLGKELVSINDYPIQQVVDSLSTLIVIDNKSTVKNIIPRMIGFVPHLEYFGFSTTDSIRITTKDMNDNIVEIIFEKELVGREKVVRFEPDSISYCWKSKNQFFTQTYFPNDSIYYIQYNRCWSRELEKLFGSSKRAKTFPSFNKFQKEIFEQFENNSANKIIFDLRFNVGGSSLQGTRLIKRLAHYDNVNQKDKLFVVTGKHTYSSGIINVMDFKENTKATFVGEVTSGRPNHYGEVKYLILPSSGLKLSYSTKYFNKYIPDENAFYPDIEIETSFQDFKTGIDPVYEYIKDL